MRKRRKFLAQTGVTLSGLVSVGAVSAGRGKKRGVRKRIAKLLRRGEVKEAEQLAGKHDIEYQRGRITVETSDRVSSQDTLQKPNPGYIDLIRSSARKDEEDWFTLR